MKTSHNGKYKKKASLTLKLAHNSHQLTRTIEQFELNMTTKTKVFLIIYQ